MSLDPVSGPVPREILKSLVDAPFGEALKTIRKYDPLYGRIEGEPVKWRVHFERELVESGSAIVEASSEKEALEIAELLDENDVSWDDADTSHFWPTSAAVLP